MLYHILDYNFNTHIAKGIPASEFRGEFTSSGHVVNLFCNKPVEVNRTYSFELSDEFVEGTFVRGHSPEDIK